MSSQVSSRLAHNLLARWPITVTALALGAGVWTLAMSGIFVSGILLIAGFSIWLTLLNWWRPVVAFSATVLFSFGGFAVWIQLTQFLPGSLEVKSLAVLAIILLVAIVCNALLNWKTLTSVAELFWSPSGAQRKITASGRALAVLLVVGIAVVFFIVHEITRPTGYSFAMNEDAVWNTVSARFMMHDGGLVTSVHPHSSPFSPALLALVMSMGRSGVDASQLLTHDMSAAGDVWLIITFLTAAVAALIAAGLVPRERRILSLVVACAGILVVLSWFVAGWAFALGYYNASFALVVLLTAWLAWREARVNPRVLSIALACATVALLSTWAPLAIVPLAMWIMHVWNSRRTHSWISHAVAFVLVVAYVVAVTLPDMRRESGALAFDGGMFALRALDIVIYLALAAGLAVIVKLKHIGVRELEGTLTFVISASIGIGYLMYQRRDAESLWGYYPAKMSWLIGVLAVLVSVSFAAGLIAHARRRASQLWLSVATACGLVGCVILVRPPGLSDSFPLLSIATGTGVSKNDDVIPQLSVFAEPATKNVVFRLHDGVRDRFENMWLLQLPSSSGSDVLRTYAYYLDGADVTGLCDVIRVWGEGVHVQTSDPELESEVLSKCPVQPTDIIVSAVE